jgi:dTDP-4-dehydrorhamnose reductase
MWAGIECTIARVGDRWRDELELQGHYDRTGDIDRLAALDVRVIRYPVLWERHAHHGEAAWQRTGLALGRMRELGIEPLVALLHHGSGPRETSLVAPDFVPRFARYAAEVARRFPWVTRWVPVNEPLSTARFAALYGHWHPHLRDDDAFVRALVTETRAIQVAMQAIRRVNPRAELVLSEDLARTHATPCLRYQADFENERRWLTFDLLAGRVDRGHPLWGYLDRGPGVRRDLDALAAEPCPPHLLGLNYYATSERWLDDRVALYPGTWVGGNGRDAYVDVEATRAPGHPAFGLRRLLDEAWHRYRLPMALTEVHLGCTREQQLRWLRRAWDAACDARRAGIDLRAVMAWSAFGSFDWDTLLTQDNGRYEPGLFDVRSPTPRRTALASMVFGLARNGDWTHPAVEGPGWWERPVAPAGAGAAPVLVTGAAGRLGRAVVRACEERGLHHVAATRRQLDVTDRRAVERWLDDAQPWAVVNAAGYARVDDAEERQADCFLANIDGAGVLAEACAQRGIALLTVSSDLVFGHGHEAPIPESASPAPLGAYGWSKAQAERRVRRALPAALVVRSAHTFAAEQDGGFLATALEALEEGHEVPAAHDLVLSPTYVPDLVHAALDLLIDGEQGLWHLANTGPCSFAGWARQLAELAGHDARAVVERAAKDLDFRAPRPQWSALGSERGTIMPHLGDALARFLAARRAASPVPAVAAGPIDPHHPELALHVRQ